MIKHNSVNFLSEFLVDSVNSGDLSVSFIL